MGQTTRGLTSSVKYTTAIMSLIRDVATPWTSQVWCADGVIGLPPRISNGATSQRQLHLHKM